MAAAYRSSLSTNTGATAASSITVSLPAGIQYHDVLIAAITHDGGTSSTINTPSGWTLLRIGSSAGALLRMTVFWRLVDGSEPANYTWTFDAARQAAAAICAYSGAATTPPPGNNGVSTTTAGLSLAGTGANCTQESGLGLQFFSTRNTTGSVTQTANAAYTKREDTCTTASVFIGLAAQDNVKGLPVTSTSATGNTLSVASTGLMIAIFLEDARPAFLPMNADEYFVGSITASASSMTGSVLSNVPNVTFLALVTINKDTSTVSSITTTGLTWALVSRTNTNAGSTELWRAFSAAPLASTATTVTLSTSVVSASFLIAGLIHADFTSADGSSAIGAISTGTFSSAAPSISLTTTRSGSWVWCVAQSATTAAAVTAGSAQTVVRTQTDATNTTQSLLWRQTNRTLVAGTTVTMNLTAPTTGTGNMLVVEILPHRFGHLSTLGAG